MIDGCINLSDGRTLGFAEFGQMDGHPIFVMHGTPGARFDLFAHQAAKITPGNARVIVPERPGYGLSDPKSDRSLLDWAGDLRELADYLGMERFSLVGIAGGGPYAIASAYRMPRRIAKAAVISGMGPVDVPESGNNISAERPRGLGNSESLAAYTNQLVDGVQTDPDAFVASFLARLPASDRTMITQDMLPLLRELAIEAARRTGGVMDDYQVLERPWGIPLEEIQVPIHFWHSDGDERIPLVHVQDLTRRIPNSVLHQVTGIGHYGTPLLSCQSVLSFLIDGYDLIAKN